eukprot:m.93979 g.93979  ORF g.93979 m.93979 type:complete len:337 (+) comp20340_c0_seq4:207-1217(+)
MPVRVIRSPLLPQGLLQFLNLVDQLLLLGSVLGRHCSLEFRLLLREQGSRIGRRRCRCRCSNRWRSGRWFAGRHCSLHCRKDVANLIFELSVGLIKGFVDNHEIKIGAIIVVCVLELGDRSCETTLDFVLSLSASGPESLLQLLDRRRLDENVPRLRVERRLLHTLHALDVNVEDADLVLPNNRRDGRLGCPVVIAVNIGGFNELAGLDHRRHRWPISEVIVDSILLSRPRIPSGVRDAETKGSGVFLHQHRDERPLSNTRRSRNHNGPDHANLSLSLFHFIVTKNDGRDFITDGPNEPEQVTNRLHDQILLLKKLVVVQITTVPYNQPTNHQVEL